MFWDLLMLCVLLTANAKRLGVSQDVFYVLYPLKTRLTKVLTKLEKGSIDYDTKDPLTKIPPQSPTKSQE